jgi:hypothetical protein
MGHRAARAVNQNHVFTVYKQDAAGQLETGGSLGI